MVNKKLLDKLGDLNFDAKIGVFPGIVNGERLCQIII